MAQQRKPLPDDMPQDMINVGGQLMPRHNPSPTASPSSVPDPRHRGFDWGNDIAKRPVGNPVEELLKAMEALGGAMPLSVMEGMADWLSPRTKGVDVKLPNESGQVDPRLRKP